MGDRHIVNRFDTFQTGKQFFSVYETDHPPALLPRFWLLWLHTSLHRFYIFFFVFLFFLFLFISFYIDLFVPPKMRTTAACYPFAQLRVLSARDMP